AVLDGDDAVACVEPPAQALERHVDRDELRAPLGRAELLRVVADGEADVGSEPVVDLLGLVALSERVEAVEGQAGRDDGDQREIANELESETSHGTGRSFGCRGDLLDPHIVSAIPPPRMRCSWQNPAMAKMRRRAG